MPQTSENILRRLQVPVVRAGDRYLISWTPELVWPGLQPGEQLVSAAKPPDHRGAILSTNRMVLARGPADDRQYPQGAPFYTLTGFHFLHVAGGLLGMILQGGVLGLRGEFLRPVHRQIELTAAVVQLAASGRG